MRQPYPIKRIRKQTPQFAAMTQAPLRESGSGVKQKLARRRRGCRPRHPGVTILPNRKAPANSGIEPFSPEFSIAFLCSARDAGGGVPYVRICRLRVLRQPSSNDRVRTQAMKSDLLPYLRDPSRIKDSDPTERILQTCSAGRSWQNSAENAVIPPDSVIQYKKTNDRFPQEVFAW